MISACAAASHPRMHPANAAKHTSSQVVSWRVVEEAVAAGGEHASGGMTTASGVRADILAASGAEGPNDPKSKVAAAKGTNTGVRRRGTRCGLKESGRWSPSLRAIVGAIAVPGTRATVIRQHRSNL